MRCVDSCSSAARLRAVSVAATQRQRGVRWPGRRPRPRARSQSSSTPAAASGSASRQGSGMPSSSRRSSSSSSASAASRPSSAVALRGARRSPPAAARPAARPRRARCRPPRSAGCVELTTSSASAMSAAARLAAAAGLLSSCASPAAIVPSDGQALAVLLDGGEAGHHRRHLAHDPVVHRRAARTRAGGSRPARISRCRHGAVRARIRTPSGAAGEHGDRADPGRRDLAPDGSGPPVALTSRSARCPRAAGARPGGSSPCSASMLAGLERLLGATAAHSLELGVVEVVEEVDRRAGRRRP